MHVDDRDALEGLHVACSNLKAPNPNLERK